jgi:hypothetical protein
LITDNYTKRGVLEIILGVAMTKSGKFAGQMPETAKKRRAPGAGLTDSQSAKSARAGGESPGADGSKRIRGCKRHIITDTGGLLLTAEIHAANENEGKAGQIPERLF